MQLGALRRICSSGQGSSGVQGGIFRLVSVVVMLRTVAEMLSSSSYLLVWLLLRYLASSSGGLQDNPKQNC